MLYNSALHAIGNTPLIRMSQSPTAPVYAKLEYLNPGGSVKDRSALFMVEEAERRGDLKPGGTIVDASSGNHGVAIAMIGAIKKYRVIITVSEKISTEKLQTIRALGAEVVMCPSTEFIEDPRSYHSQAVAIHKKTPGSFMPNQYYNLDNSKAHYTLLGPEIWQQTNGNITHFFAAAGTCGTVSGVGKYLKEKNPAIKIIALDAATSFYSTKGNPQPYKVEGMGIDFKNDILNHAVIDDILPITDTQALGMLPAIAHSDGLLVGPSSGAVLYGAVEYCKNLGPDTCAVAICGDSGRAYLTKNFF